MSMKLVFFLILTVISLEAKLNLWKDFLFPKDPNIIRVRNPDDVKTEINNVTTLDFIGLVERHGYSAEEHYVTTEDGFNLMIHRIGSPLLTNNQQTKEVIYFQHGLFASSDCWVVSLGPKNLVFLLADQGYDIWFGNVRGNSYCRSHVKLSPRNRDFWQFSFHEVGTKDLPVMIDYVLNYTKQRTLRYVGHSMGTTELFILLSMNPAYNAKIKLGILLAPVAILNIPPVLEQFRNKIPEIKELLDFNEIYELGSLSSTSITVARTLCSDKAITQAVCIAAIFLLFGSDPVQFNTMALPEILSHFPAGSSVQTIHHFYQNIITKKFQTYDYGYFGNYKQYGQATPILYDLKKITAPLALFYSLNDLLAPKSNVLEIYKNLSNVILLEENPFEMFSHGDFLWAIDAKVLLYNRIIEVFKEFDTGMNN